MIDLDIAKKIQTRRQVKTNFRRQTEDPNIHHPLKQIKCDTPVSQERLDSAIDDFYFTFVPPETEAALASDPSPYQLIATLREMIQWHESGILPPETDIERVFKKNEH